MWFDELARKMGFNRSALRKDQVRIVDLNGKLVMYRVPWKSSKWR